MSIQTSTIKRKHPEALCEQCPLYAKPCAPSQGPPQAKVALVSRSPGYYEAMAGKPFSGPSGKVLDFLLNEQGIKREEILVTNTVLCAPDAGKVPPEAIKACSPRLRSELDGTELVIAAGSEAVNLILGRGSIDRYRGYRIQQQSRVVVATNNPALVLRDDSTFPNLRRDFRRAFNPLPEPTLPKVEVIEDGGRARDFLASIGPGTISADIESRGGLTHKGELVSLQFGTGGEDAVVLGEREGLWRDTDFVENHLRPFFQREDLNFVWHNGKFDVKILRHTYGIRARVDEDTMLLSYACDERGGVHALEYLLMEEFGWPNYEPKSVKEFKRTGEVTDYDELYQYAGWDVAGSFQLYELLSERARNDGVDTAYRRLLIEGSESLARIELSGFHYDSVKAGDVMEEEVGPELKRITKDMQKLLDNPIFSPRSTKQVAHLYYDQWKCTHAMQKRPDKARSADEAALKEISAGRFKLPIIPAVVEKIAEEIFEEPRDVFGVPLVQTGESIYRMVEVPKPQPNESQVRKHIQQFTDMLLRYRELDKTASTYIVGMIKRAEDDPDKKVYTDLLLHGTTTGRLSSRNPNLQNITRAREGLPNIRSLFRASNSRYIVQADYSQAELRCIAHFSGDEKLLRVYEDDLDLHSITAERFYGPDFTKQNRDNSKNCNFGMFYRQSAATFQEKHGIPEAEAQRYINWAKQEFKRVWEWEDEIEELVRKDGVLVSPFGRKRRFHLLTPENLQAVFREAINFYPQTTASDFTLRSVIILSREIDWKLASIVLTVHDSILGDVSEDYVGEYERICREVMESRPKDELGWTIPFKIDIHSGPTWGEVE